MNKVRESRIIRDEDNHLEHCNSLYLLLRKIQTEPLMGEGEGRLGKVVNRFNGYQETLKTFETVKTVPEISGEL